MNEVFHCHLKGKFPHPRNTTVYLKCPGAGAKACLCHCKYEEMCFDVRTSLCKFEFLDDLIDCSRPLAVSFREVVTQIHPPVVRPNLYQNSKAVVVVSHPVNKNITASDSTTTTTTTSKEYDFRREELLEKSGDLHLTQIIHEHSLIHSHPKLKSTSYVQKTTLAARQNAKPLHMIVQDHSSFPTWAVALVVLCIIILLVLIVLLMY